MRKRSWIGVGVGVVLVMQGGAWAEGVSAPASGTPPPPPVITLTQEELQTFTQAEATKAVAGFAAQQATERAKEVYSKIHGVFPTWGVPGIVPQK